MAHIFELTNITAFNVPSLKEVTILGAGDIVLGGWGLTPPIDDRRYRISTQNPGANFDSEVLPFNAIFGPICGTFRLRGLMKNDVMAIYSSTDGKDELDRTKTWVRSSETVLVKDLLADGYLKDLALDKLQKSTQNPKIGFYPFGSRELDPPIAPDAWIASVQATMDKMYRNPVGKKIIDLIKKPMIIQCLIVRPIHQNAFSSQISHVLDLFDTFSTKLIFFSPQHWSGSGAGDSADEILLHEMIHALEDNYDGYKDPPDSSFLFDKADFLTVNGTNVYSSLNGRFLRKDHRGFVAMTAPYNADPKAHFDLFTANYEAAMRRNTSLYYAFKYSPAIWNPFAFDRPDQSLLVYVLPEKRWVWRYELFANGAATWIDTNNSAEKGTGTWSESGGTITINWHGSSGSWDRFPKVPKHPGYREGRTRAGGTEYDTEIISPSYGF